jgi:hypothetical protein
MVEFIVSSEKKLVIERFHNKVSLDLLVNTSHAIWNHLDYDIYLKGLVDIRGCKIEIGIKDIPQLTAFFFNNAKTTKGFMVILADSQQSIAKSFIFKSKMSKLMNIHITSSLDDAFRNLGIDESTYDLINSDQVQQIQAKTTVV